MNKDADFVRVKVGDLKPNPHREAPIVYDDRRLESLTNSIEEKGFWNNVLIRKHKENGKVEFQIAYGHHRLWALRKIRGTNAEVTLPMQELTDEDMLKIMAEENYNEFGLTPRQIIETVRAARKFLVNHKDILVSFIEKRDLQDWKPPKTGTCLTKKQEAERRADIAITQGIGAPIISQWLGKNWNQTKVSQALSSITAIEDGILDEEDINACDTQAEAKKLTDVIQRHAIPEWEQKNPVRRNKEDTEKSASETREDSYSTIAIKIIDSLDELLDNNFQTCPKGDKLLRKMKELSKMLASFNGSIGAK